MKERTTRTLLRSVALVGAMAAGATAFGADQVWSGGASGSWSDSANWVDGAGPNGNYVVNDTTQNVQINFGLDAESIATGLWIENGGENTVTFSGELDGGLTVGSTMNIGTGFGAGKLTLSGGTYVSNGDVILSNGGTGILTVGPNTVLTCTGSDNTARWVLLGWADTAGEHASTINLDGGTLETWHIQRYTTGGTCEINFANNGKLKALDDGQLVGDNWTEGRLPTIVVASTGGIIDTNGKAVTIDAPVTGSGTLTVTGGGSASFTAIPADTVTIVAEGEGTTVTVAKDETYTWTGAADDGNRWATPANWTVAGAVPATAPAADSVVVIPEGEGELTILCAYATDYTGYLTINRDVRLARAEPSNSSGPNGINITKVEGTGTLTLAGSVRSSGDAAQDRFHVRRGAGNLPFEIDVNLNTTGRIRLMDPNGLPRLTLNGVLSGDGIIYFDNHSNGEGIIFNGDTSAFTGSFSGCGSANWTREGTKFGGAARGSASAYWSFGCWEGNERDIYGYTPFLVNGVTYQFGQLNAPKLHFWRGYTGSNTTDATVEVGALADKTSTVTGSLAPNNTLRKVGATSTLEYANSGTSNGTVEAYEGTTVIKGTGTGFALKFTGPTATIKIARSSTTDSGVEDDPATEDVDESKTTTTYIPASFVPVFAGELVGGLYEVAQEEVDGVTYDVYTAVTVAKDSADVEYYTVAAAFAALAEAEDKTVTLIHDYSTTIELPLGYTLDSAGFSCTVTGAAGVSVVETDGVWTTEDNSAATWIGGTEGNWADAANWSSGAVPNSGTSVKFTESATVYISDYSSDNGYSAHKCGSIEVASNATVEFAPPERNQTDYWPRIEIYGDITGGETAVVKLYRCGLRNQKGSSVAVGTQLRFENDGTHDSWMENGDFTFTYSVSGTGMLKMLNGSYTFSGNAKSGIDIPEGSVIVCDRVPHFSHQYEWLRGSGRIVIPGAPGTRFANALKNGESWTGTCELLNMAINGINFANYGNANSTVCANGVTGYLSTAETSTQVASIKTLEIGPNGLTLNNTLSNNHFIFSAAITGSGTIVVGTAANTGDADYRYYFFTGDMSGFTGGINFGSLAADKAPVVLIKRASDNMVNATAKGQIIVQANASANVASTWTSLGGVVIDGEVTLGEGGGFAGGEISGTGTITCDAAPTALGTFGEGWTGTFVVDWEPTGAFNPNLYGTANSTVAMAQDLAASAYFGPGTKDSLEIAPALRLDTDVEIKNGYADTTDAYAVTFSRLTGDGDLTTWTTGTANAKTYFYVGVLDNFGGTLNVQARTKVSIVRVNVDEEPDAGDLVVEATVGSGAEIAGALILSVAGVDTETALVLKDDGLYMPGGETDAESVEPGDSVTVETAEEAAAVVFAVPDDVSDALDSRMIGLYESCFQKVIAETEDGFVVSFEPVELVTNSVVVAVETIFGGETPQVTLQAIAASTEATEVTIQSVPGFYYGVSVAAGVGGGVLWTTEAEMATDLTTTIEFPAADGAETQFYRIIVSPTDPTGVEATPVEDPAIIVVDEGDSGEGA